MTRKPVESSLLKSVGYSAETKTLELEFMRGGIYTYKSVPPEKHTALLGAPFIGSYFLHEIKGVYDYEKITQTT